MSMMSEFTTVVEAIQRRAESLGSRDAFIFRDNNGGRRVLSWQQIYHLGGRWAAVLKAGSIGQGQLVLNTLLNSPERVVAEVGILLSGAASVNGQCQLADGSDLLHGLRVSRAQAIFLDPDVPNSPWNVLKKVVTPPGENGEVTSEQLPHLRLVYFIRRQEEGSDGDFLRQLDNLSEWFQADVRPDDIMSMFTTSGSTGFSKLVVFTHGDFLLCFTCMALCPYFEESVDSVDLILSPLGWSGGYTGTPFITGHKRVLCDVRGGGNPSDVVDFVWKCCQEEKCTMLFLPPAIIVSLAERIRQRQSESGDLKAWDWIPDSIVLGTQPVTRDMVKSAKAVGKRVFVSYGSTEFAVISFSEVADPDTFTDHDAGCVIETGQVEIVDAADEYVSLLAGQIGNILVKRPGMMKEYLNNPKATADAFTPDGFFRTGDVGSLDERGHLIVAGRGSDAIMRGAYIFYPGWLEERIRTCPGVVDVLVVGVPDPLLHEELCACVVLTSDNAITDDVRKFVEKDIVTAEDDPLSPRPRYYLRFESFPTTETGKPKRKVVKMEAAARLTRK